ncbi:MAG: peptide ABC transporter substrate-binding protein [Anaerolineales bacterium]
MLRSLRTGVFFALIAVTALSPLGMVWADQSAPAPEAIIAQDGGEPVTSYFTSTTNVSTLDPARGEDSLSINWIENLFLGLTNNNPLNNFEIQPELATSWTTEDGQRWVFNIRTDVPWVRYDPATGESEILGNVTATDIEWSIKRACDPRLGSRYSSIIAGVIAGCDIINRSDSDSLTDEDIFGDTVQVSAPDEATLIIDLQYPAPFFFSMTSIWTIRPVHRPTVEEFGDNWTDPGIIVTNGPYMVEELTPDVRRVAVRNPHIPQDIIGPGNIDRIEINNVRDGNTTFSLFLNDQVDIAGIPAAELESVRTDPVLSQQIVPSFNSSVSYIAFDHARPPFDDVHLRRAFNAVIDRETYIQQIALGQGEPMLHFTPPGMFGAPPSLNDPGIGFNPEYAREQLALSGYPNCEGLPPISVATGSGGGDTFQFLQSSVAEHLGCPEDLFTIEELEFSVLLEITAFDQPVQNRPHMWSLAWGPDYPDANNWVGDVISCFKDNNFLRPCSEVDDLIEAAARETDPTRRTELYFEVEARLFGRQVDSGVTVDGETPFIPLALSSAFSLIKPWYDGPFETDGLIGGAHWDWRTVDQEAQQAARDGN